MYKAKMSNFWTFCSIVLLKVEGPTLKKSVVKGGNLGIKQPTKCVYILDAGVVLTLFRTLKISLRLMGSIRKKKKKTIDHRE